MYAFLTGGAGVGKSVVIRALYQTLYRILNLKDGENPDDKRILLCAYMGFALLSTRKCIRALITIYQLMS